MSQTKIITLKLSSESLKHFLAEDNLKGKKKQTTQVKAEDNSSLSTPSKLKKPIATSPVPDASNEGSPAPQSLGRQGLAKSENKLDKSGSQVRKWTKKPLKIQSFTGYSLSFKSWKGEDSEKPKKKEKKSSGLKIHLKLNKKLNLVDSEREQSPDDSSVVSTPDVSAAATPLHN